MSKRTRDHGRPARSRPSGVGVFGGWESKSMISDVEEAVVGLPHLDAAACTGLPAASVTVPSTQRRLSRYSGRDVAAEPDLARTLDEEGTEHRGLGRVPVRLIADPFLTAPSGYPVRAGHQPLPPAPLLLFLLLLLIRQSQRVRLSGQPGQRCRHLLQGRLHVSGRRAGAVG